MLKRAAVLAVAVILGLVILGLGTPGKPASLSGSWQVDTRHSDAKLITDATTDYGKTKINVALGYGRLMGKVNVDDADPTKSKVDFRFYPATTMTPAIAEDGKFLTNWLRNMSNHTLVCFHSKQVVRLPDGRLQATGEMAITRVDRSVQSASGEAYSGPEYGPPDVHRVAREETVVFDLGNGKNGTIRATSSTRLVREDFPQLVKAVVNTYWPPLIQDENCQVPDANEAYSGSKCTGTYMATNGLPPEPAAANGEDVGAQQNFNAVVGEHLTILLHMNLTPQTGGQVAGGY